MILGIACVFLLASSCEVSTANITDVRMCEVTQALQCEDDQSAFATTTPVLYLTAVLNNAPTGTNVTASWYYLGEEEITFIDDASVESVDTTSDLEFSLTKPDNDWPKGKYKAVLQIDTENAEPVEREFIVE